jgi:hypothetical protein
MKKKETIKKNIDHMMSIINIEIMKYYLDNRIIDNLSSTSTNKWVGKSV